MAVLAPFNAPAFIAVKKTAYALAAGCPVLLKPSPHAPHAANLIADAMQEALNAHGLPGGYFQLLHGDAEVGGQLAEDPRVRCVTFTGSRAGGQSVAGSAASSSLKPLQLECGSNNPAIVRADADIERTADALVAGMTKLNGQWCEGPGTVFVHERQHDQLIDAVLDRLSGIAVGPARDLERPSGHRPMPPRETTSSMRSSDCRIWERRWRAEATMQDGPVLRPAHRRPWHLSGSHDG